MSTSHQDTASRPLDAFYQHGSTPTRPWQLRVGFWLLIGIAAFSIAEERDSVQRFGEAYKPLHGRGTALHSAPPQCRSLGSEAITGPANMPTPVRGSRRPGAYEQLLAAGAARVVRTDSIMHPSNCISIAGVLSPPMPAAQWRFTDGNLMKKHFTVTDVHRFYARFNSPQENE